MTESDRPTGSTRLPTAYVPAEVETVLYERWVDRGYFTADASSDKPPFTVMIPPPNVTGSLHIGHAFEHTLIDALTRRARMRGFETLWLPGMDHASIAVHALVERALAAEGTSRRELGREAFVDRVWSWKAEHGGAILSQMRRLGDGVDWSRERFTMDEGLSLAVRTMFKKLYDDGLIYRAERLVNWSPVLRSVLSDAEVVHEDVEGELVSMRYGSLDDAEPHIVVATTRVETMLGDTAVAVHPDDERYTHLVGTELELPLTGRRIPVIADAHVDPAFGTGAVKVTPAHDPNDFEIGQRHNLPMPTIMDEQGRISGTGTEFDGLDRFQARVAVRERLAEQGRIVAEKRPYLHSVGHSERSKEPIEPRLSLQWFVKVGPLAQAAGDAVRDGRVAVSPPEMTPRYLAWTDNLHDWCISRQLWWGHRIPVWYSPDGAEQVCLGPDEQPPAGWVQDEDVLDTWFSAGLWPFSTLGWPEPTADLAKFYPTTVLVTGYDILFFWVVRMMMFGLYAMRDEQPAEQVPFHTIALHGMVRDQFGKKMSKTRGNGIDPIEWMDRYGTDAVRFTFARGANPGVDLPLAEDAVAGSSKFCNKLFNATRFALLNGATTSGELPATLTGADAWIISRLHAVIAEVDRYWESYEFAKAAEALYHFAWDELCDWYVELAKVSLTDEASAPTTRLVLGEVLDVVLRLLHPFTPFVTETLWTELTGGDSVVVADWPEADEKRLDPAAEQAVETVQAVVLEVRRFRSDQGVKPSQRIPARITGLDEAGIALYEPQIRSLLRLTEPADGFTATASLQTGSGVRIELDMSSAVDVAAERTRFARDLATAQKELEQTAKKLGNEAFLANARPEVVASIQRRHEIAQADIARITAAIQALPPA